MDEDPTKFNTCQFRSPNEVVYTYPTCCQVVTAIGYYCRKVEVNGVLPRYCNMCIHYEKKED